MRLAMPSVLGPAPVIRRFGSIAGAGPSVRLPGRSQTVVPVEAEAAALAAGVPIAVEEAVDAVRCTCSTIGF
jgi:hypothetical protein